MTSDARKQAWLEHIEGPVSMDNLLPWGIIWKFTRTKSQTISYRLVLPRMTRKMECHIRPEHFDLGAMALERQHLAPLLRRKLSDEDLAKAMAAILTYSSQKVKI